MYLFKRKYYEKINVEKNAQSFSGPFLEYANEVISDSNKDKIFEFILSKIYPNCLAKENFEHFTNEDCELLAYNLLNEVGYYDIEENLEIDDVN